eukprot:4184878-Pleurochrysis_carterae.AAC.1
MALLGVALLGVWSLVAAAACARACLRVAASRLDAPSGLDGGAGADVGRGGPGAEAGQRHAAAGDWGRAASGEDGGRRGREGESRVRRAVWKCWQRTMLGRDACDGPCPVQAVMALRENFRRCAQDELRSGVVLCHLINRLDPGTIEQICHSDGAEGRRENVLKYLGAARSIGVLEADMFSGA